MHFQKKIDPHTPLLRLTAVGLATALALTGCASLENTDSNTDTSTPSSSTAEKKTGKSNSAAGNDSVATGGEGFAGAREKTRSFGSDAAPGQFPRTVTHARGTTELKKKPQRVVVLESGELDSVLALGMKPVGMTTSKGQNPIPEYMADQASGIDTVGTINEVNMEKIASLQPDLIIGSQLRMDKYYDQLNSIAPTVFSIRPGYTWKENFRLIGEALGEEERTEQVMADYDKKIEEVKKVIQEGPATEDTTVSILRFLPGKVRLYGRLSLIGTVLDDAGLARPANQNIEELATEISPENIDQADADYIFYCSYGDPAATGQDTAIATEAFQQLPAVKNGHAIEVSDDAWGLGLGPLGAQTIAADLAQYLSH
ncbi:ABC transporter substrate-binding protein [Corynebacterium striatum]|uniref:ABC transporter substrate-binding protein n=1 Tax=Corynebacterium striatum TaxID=43770 RepID=UPI0014191F7C|nr:iron-siderophore ABC transporter substrate-binding protein [Corynebacterium striatum]NHY10021.1 iron-siderophore ABC transporter substrate-binding protein [Corynebacterium striatum]NHY34627.1 iron-siderophore ABC transporter substrate-binding protein [Corynebacterium striatum]QQU78917.1 iron-siderophore ABC transporter substrate-binding protein [Corynebacterium striatum]HAT1131221.1 iron-siderophore ABC transporter substrate-binding protein [Corynebacterium striatum]HAT1139038.1 iron-sidero